MSDGSGDRASSAAGASLRREHGRRTAARDARIRAEHPRVGGFILALTDEPASTRAFAVGARGEEKVAAVLHKHAGQTVLLLHNRRLGSSRRGDIDHLAVAPSGIFVIDTKHYAGKKIEVRRSGGWFSETRERLFIGGRDHAQLLESVERQVVAVRQAMDALPEAGSVPVHPIMCFVGADLPLLATLRIAGVPLLGPKDAAAAIRASGPLEADSRRRIHAHLAARLPQA
jgi:Nuclease-related domain